MSEEVKKATVSGMEWAKREVGEEGVRKEMEAGLYDLEGHCRGAGFPTEIGAIGVGVGDREQSIGMIWLKF